MGRVEDERVVEKVVLDRVVDEPVNVGDKVLAEAVPSDDERLLPAKFW